MRPNDELGFHHPSIDSQSLLSGSHGLARRPTGSHSTRKCIAKEEEEEEEEEEGRGATPGAVD